MAQTINTNIERKIDLLLKHLYSLVGTPNEREISMVLMRDVRKWLIRNNAIDIVAFNLFWAGYWIRNANRGYL